MCQGALGECNIFTALSTIQILLLKYTPGQRELTQTRQTPQETCNPGTNQIIAAENITQSLDTMPKVEVPNIKDEEPVSSQQVDYSAAMDLFSCVKTDNGANHTDDKNIEVEYKSPETTVAPENKIPKHLENGGSANTDLGITNKAIKTVQQNKKKTKRINSTKKTRKCLQEEGQIATKEEPRISCSVCKRLIAKKHMERHFRRVHNSQEIGEFECAECQIKFNHQSKLDHHMAQTHVPQTCTVCNEIFTGTVHLNIHMKLHRQAPVQETNSSIVCNQCGKSLPSQYRLERHLRKEHNHVEPGLFSCDICQITFRTASWLKIHMKQHASGFSCKTCSEKFPDYLSYRKHQLKHWKRYCKLCPAQLPYGSNEYAVSEISFFFCSGDCANYLNQTQM